jgi:hypothetical protein
MGHREREIFVKSSYKKCMAIGLYVIAWGAPAIGSDQLARLFFNTTERQAMNEKRRMPKHQTPAVANSMKNPSAETESKTQDDVTESVEPRPPKITGQVIRSSGNNTVWINHAPNYLPNSTRRPPIE